MTSAVATTETGVVCAKCSHWENGHKVQVRHASVAAVKLCFQRGQSALRPDGSIVGAEVSTPTGGSVPASAASVVSAAWDKIAEKKEYAEYEAAQERAVYEGKMRRDEELANGGPWPSKKLEVVAGRYAVMHDGVLKFYKVDKPTEGRWAGYTFVNVQASDELYPVRNRQAREEILNLIAVDPQAAMLRYGMELGHCGHCGRTLTNEESREYGIGPICRDKMGW